jgi:hypothetical protein
LLFHGQRLDQALQIYDAIILSINYVFWVYKLLTTSTVGSRYIRLHWLLLSILLSFGSQLRGAASHPSSLELKATISSIGALQDHIELSLRFLLLKLLSNLPNCSTSSDVHLLSNLGLHISIDVSLFQDLVNLLLINGRLEPRLLLLLFGQPLLEAGVIGNCGHALFANHRCTFA